MAVFLFGWWLVTHFGWVDPKFVPSPGAVWDRFQQSIHTETRGTADFPIVKRGLQNYYLWQHWWASLQRVLWGLFWAIVVGVPLGLLLATVRWFRVIVEPYVDFLRALPPLAYFSLLILWFGIGDTSKIWLLFLAGLAPIALSIVSGARGIPRDRLLAAQALGASRLQTMRHLVLPSVLPELFNGLRLAVGFILTTDRGRRDDGRPPRHRRSRLGVEEDRQRRHRHPLHHRHRPDRPRPRRDRQGARAMARPLAGTRLTHVLR